MLTAQAVDLVQRRAAQVGVDQEDPPAGEGEADGQVAGRGGLSVPGVGAGDQEHLEPLVAAAEVDVGPDGPVRLGPVRVGLGVADQADRAHCTGPSPGQERHLAEHRQARQPAELVERADPLIQEVEHHRSPRAQHAADHQRHGQGQAHLGPDRATRGLGRLDDLGGDAAVGADELRLLELVDYPIEQRPLPLQLAAQVLLSQQVLLELLGLLLVLSELLAEFVPHRLD